MTNQELLEKAEATNCVKIVREQTGFSSYDSININYYFVLEEGKYYEIWKSPIYNKKNEYRYNKERITKKVFLDVKREMKAKYKDLKLQVDSLKENYG